MGILARNDVQTIVSIFALASKKRLVLLSPDDPIETLISQIQATHVQVLLGEADLIEELAPYLCHESLSCHPDMLFFTSGTTSKAKAVVLSEASLCASAYNGGALLPLSRKDNLLSLLPLSHVFGFVCSLLWPLSFGAEVSLCRDIRDAFGGFALFRPTVVSLVPAIAAFLSAKGLFNPELSLVLIGAGDCPDAVLSGIAKSGIRVSFGYGLTETSSGVALSLGEDPRAMTVCPDFKIRLGDDGEVIVSAPTTMMKGYFEDQAATDAAIIDGELHTGDLGRIEDGLLYLTGRKKETLVLSDGSKIFLPEYESELAASLGQDSDFAVMLSPKGVLTLYIHKPKQVEGIVEKFNLGCPRSHQIAKIIYANSPLPRTKTGKVRRYLISLGDNL